MMEAFPLPDRNMYVLDESTLAPCLMKTSFNRAIVPVAIARTCRDAEMRLALKQHDFGTIGMQGQI